MECEKIKPLLDDFADGELRSPEREAVEAHLKSCAACREELSAICRTVSLLKEFGHVEEPGDFVERVRERIEAPRRNVFEWLLARPALTRVLVPVACVLVAGVGIWLAVQEVITPRAPVGRRGLEAAKKPAVVAHEYKEADDFGGGESRLRSTGVSKGNAKGESFDEVRGKEEAHPAAAPGQVLSDVKAEKAGESLARENALGVVEGRAWANGTRENALGKSGAAVTLLERPADTQLVLEGAARPEESKAPAYARGGETGAKKAPLPAERQEKLAEKHVVATAPEEERFPSRPAKPKVAEEVPETGQALFSTATSSPGAPPPVGGPPAEEAVRGIGAAPSIESRRARLEVEQKPGKEAVWTFEARPESAKRVAEAGTDLEVEEAAKEESPVLGEELETSHEKKDQPSVPERGEDVSLYLNNAAPLKEQITGEPQVQSLNGSVGGDFFQGDLMAGNLYGVSWGIVPELILTVADRKKAVAEITKAVTELGGAVEFPVQRRSVLRARAEMREADLVVVQLNEGAYRKFQERFAPSPVAGRDLRHELQIPQYTGTGHPRAVQKDDDGDGYTRRSYGYLAQAIAPREGTVTFLIRLVEVPQASEAEQAPTK